MQHLIWNNTGLMMRRMIGRLIGRMMNLIKQNRSLHIAQHTRVVN